MKKRFLGLSAIVGMIAIMGLASCNSDSSDMSMVSDSDANGYSYTNMDATSTNTSTTATKVKNTPDYVDIDAVATTTDVTSLSTSAVEATEEIYGSVVSIVAGNSAGSGVLYTYNEEYGKSFIITCFHVIDGQTSFSITYNNNTMDESDDVVYDALLVGGNEDSDIAVLSIDATGLIYADMFEDSDTIKLGSSVVCIGDPLGTLPGSVSSGVVSYVNRSIMTDSYTTRKLIQTDVAINSGNSGGGLFNTAGALIGIVNGKYSSSSIEGLGFAIPMNEARAVADELVDSALFDKANNEWYTGYVAGDYEFGFTLSVGTMTSGRSYYNVLYVSETESNDTMSGVGVSTGANSILTSITVDYKDASKTDLTYTVPSSSSITSSTATEATKFLYDAGLVLGDSVTFNYTSGSNTIFEIVQYRYSID